MTANFDDTQHVQIARYLLVATAGAWVWDVLMCLSADYRVYSRIRLLLPDAGHLMSRLASACFISISLVFAVAPVNNCDTLAKAIGGLGALAFPLHTIPFFFCARGVFFDSPKVVATFGVLWFGTLGGSIASAFFIHGYRYPSTSDLCVVRLDSVYAAGITSGALYNTAVFCAVSWNLMMYTPGEGWSRRLRDYLRRRGVSQLSKMLMEGGQRYLIPVIALNIAAATMNLIRSTPSSYKFTFVVMHVALHNAMTSRIHRLIKSGAISDVHTSHITSSNQATTRLSPTDLAVDVTQWPQTPVSFINFDANPTGGDHLPRHDSLLHIPALPRVLLRHNDKRSSLKFKTCSEDSMC
ncbi:hypothetical protein BXZ70DRAFT_928304 [Cristinia sonorae]|uniref:Uncharacterized protein n=1 Tax=Cristinia sonorae TaxID=1940300 RepID=A0A8K0UTT5_9AGAR|nr:hypothetical protein BXZ70DRAFT_928304 [Cristinia sonorae]